jgi:hypothetical protein
MNALLTKPEQLLIDNGKICYNQIYKSYYNATYGGLDTVMHMDTGYVNISQLCKTFKRQFGNWHRNKATKAMIDDLAEQLTHAGSPVTRAQMIFTVEGGSGKQKKLIGGTYVHPILFPHIVSWMDSSYAAVASILTNNFFSLQTKTGDLSSILQDAKAKPEPKAEESGDDEKEGDDDDVSSDDGEPNKLKKSFKLFVRKDPKFPYQVIETAEAKMAKAVKRFQKSPAGTDELLLEITDIPDVVSLYNMLKGSGIIKANKNTFTSKFPRVQMLAKIKEVSWSNATRAEWVEAIIKNDLAMSDDEVLSD